MVENTGMGESKTNRLRGLDQRGGGGNGGFREAHNTHTISTLWLAFGGRSNGRQLSTLKPYPSHGSSPILNPCT